MLPSATSEESIDKFIKVYPNPTSGLITLETSIIDDIKNLEVSSMDGRFIQKIYEYKNKSIDLSHLNQEATL
ncbi:MAG: T9SS type A sorting domain-containing protein [Saprospiraceae bacterium]|nr:T9SS type A sorting domain-containing protein [Saprospiraceae bacterium]